MKKNKFNFDEPTSIFVASLIHLAISIVLVLLLTSLSSIFLLGSEDPLAHSNTFSFAIILISAIVCSYALSAIANTPAICSLISGLALSALLLSLSAFVERESSASPVLLIILYIIVPILSYISSMLALKAKESKKPKFKRRKSYR